MGDTQRSRFMGNKYKPCANCGMSYDSHISDIEKSKPLSPFCSIGPERDLTKAEPPPTDGQGPAIWDLVISDLKEMVEVAPARRQRIYTLMIEDAKARDQFGEKKYSKRLRDHDGRDGLVDGYQEVLDLTVYLRKEMASALRLFKNEHYWEIKGLYELTLELWMKIRHTIYVRDSK